MTKGLKYFLIAFLISIPFSFGINLFGKNLEDFFFWREIVRNPQLFTAQINIGALKKNSSAPSLEIQAKSAISVLIDSSGEEKIVFEKESDKVLPIASLAKLMVADIVMEYYDLSQVVKISEAAVFQEGDFGNLKVGEELSIKNLLYIMLIESSNDAAYALTEQISEDGFVELMNLEAKYLGMENTHFEDSMGISPQTQSNEKDLVILTKHLLEKPLIWEILKKPEFDLYTPDKIFHHKLINTNEILREWGSDLEIIGGKTGYTPEAGGCLLLVLKLSKDGYLINIILGSEDRFSEMKQIIDFIKNARISY